MAGFLLDTNCVSEVTKKQPNAAVVDWMDRADERLLFLSVLTLGEIRKGTAGLPDGVRKAQLEAWLDGDLRQRFAGRILTLDAEIADRWGQLASRAKVQGITLPVIDGLLAATALHYNLTVVSRNLSDFAATHVAVINPWAD